MKFPVGTIHVECRFSDLCVERFERYAGQVVCVRKGPLSNGFERFREYDLLHSRSAERLDSDLFDRSKFDGRHMFIVVDEVVWNRSDQRYDSHSDRRCF